MNPRDEDLRGRRLAHYMWDELEKIAQNSLQEGNPTESQGGELEESVQSEAEGAEEASPAHGVVASRIEQLDPKKARGIPVLQPPPGFLYAPDLQAFVPDQGDPGWLAAQQAVEAARNKGWYDQGQNDQQQAAAQQEVDNQASQQVEQMAAEQQQQAQQQQVQQEQEGQAMAKEKAKATMGGLRTPESVRGGEKPKAESKTKKPAEKKPEGGKGVTIQIGK